MVHEGIARGVIRWSVEVVVKQRVFELGEEAIVPQLPYLFLRSQPLLFETLVFSLLGRLVGYAQPLHVVPEWDPAKGGVDEQLNLVPGNHSLGQYAQHALCRFRLRTGVEPKQVCHGAGIGLFFLELQTQLLPGEIFLLLLVQRIKHRSARQLPQIDMGLPHFDPSGKPFHHSEKRLDDHLIQILPLERSALDVLTQVAEHGVVDHQEKAAPERILRPLELEDKRTGNSVLV